MHTIDTETHGSYTITTYYDDSAENPQDWHDHAAVFVPWHAPSYFARSHLRDIVPGTWRRPDGTSFDLTCLDAHRYTDADDAAADFVDWANEMRATFGADVHVSFVDYGDYGANGCLIRRLNTPVPLDDPDIIHNWAAAVYGDAHCDGIIAISSLTAPGTDIDAYDDIVKADCAELQAWTQGAVYGWEITDTTTGDTVHSVWDYYDYDAMLAEARDVAETEGAYRESTLVWLRAEADGRLAVPDVAVMVAAQQRIWALDELIDGEHEPV